MPNDLYLTPVTLRRAQAFIDLHHRHNSAPRGHKFSIGVAEVLSGVLVGVACAGRPVARHLDDGMTLEVNRTCTTGWPNANSMLYGAVWRAARAMGYRRCITYTQHDETGASLRAVGWVRAAELAPRGGWAESTGESNPLRERRDPVGSGGVARVRWEITCDVSHR